MLDRLVTTTEVQPKSANKVVASIDGIDSNRIKNKDNTTNTTVFQYSSNFATNTLMTSSSPTLTDSSDEFDSSIEDGMVGDDDIADTNHQPIIRKNEVVDVDDDDKDEDEEISIVTEQLSGIDTSEAADSNVSTIHQQQQQLPSTSTTNEVAVMKRSSLIHSMEESRRLRSCRRREKLRTTTVDELSFSSRTADADADHDDDDDDILLQHSPEIQTTSVDIPKLTVQFSTITIRDYPRSIGDNPASSCGPSVSIGWKHESECTVVLDEYEENRSPRRVGREMIIPVKIREEILREMGYSRADIMKCIREINIIRGQRRRTYETLHLQSFQLLTERISRKAWNVLTLGEFKRKERMTLQELSTHHTGAATTTTMTGPTIKTRLANGNEANHRTWTKKRSSPTSTTSTAVTSASISDDSSSSSYT